MSFTPEREKELPVIPTETVVGDEGLYPIPSARIPSTNKALPPIRVEKTLSEEEILRLHELWNGAGLSARAHRRRQPAPRRLPAPISIPKPQIIPPTLLGPPADSPISSTTHPAGAMGTRKRWGFLSARPFSESQEAEKKAPNALEMLRGMAQNRLKKKIRYAKSAPNLGNQAVPMRQAVTFQLPGTIPVEATPENPGASSSHNRASPRKLATPEAVLQQDLDKDAIYFTIDPNWRLSQGSVQFEPITPIPDSPASLGRPDSPLLHRPHSLDQLSFAAQRTAVTLTAMDFPKVYPRDTALHPIDELHAYLEP